MDSRNANLAHLINTHSNREPVLKKSAGKNVLLDFIQIPVWPPVPCALFITSNPSVVKDNALSVIQPKKPKQQGLRQRMTARMWSALKAYASTAAYAWPLTIGLNASARPDSPVRDAKSTSMNAPVTLVTTEAPATTGLKVSCANARPDIPESNV
jgi:hypothetical protein